jgi:hypothetical protein
VIELADSFASTPLGGTAVSRGELYGQTLELIQEYPYTGAGLGVFPLVLSAYALLIDVPFLGHAHNVALAIWIEQGLLGIVSFVWLVAAFYGWVWLRRRRLTGPAVGAVCAVTIWLLHGMIDAPLYESRTLPLMFVPFALAIAFVPFERKSSAKSPSLLKSRGSLGALVVVFAALGALLLVSWQSVLALGEVNIGSVDQTRVEMKQHETGASMFEIRRESDLAEAQRHFERAMAWDTASAPALRRLGLIELARQNFEAAVLHLEPAWRRDPGSRATRKGLAYAYLWRGELDRAIPLLAPVREATAELDTYSWWWGTQNRDDLSRLAAQASAKLREID